MGRRQWWQQLNLRQWLPGTGEGRILLMAACLTLLVGCSMVEVYQEERIYLRDEKLPQQAMDEIKRGVPAARILDFWGPPTEQWLEKSGDQVWAYKLALETRSGGRVILLYSGMTVAHQQRFLHLVVRDGRVHKHWFADNLEMPREEPVSAAKQTAPVVEQENTAAPRPSKAKQGPSVHRSKTKG